MYLRLLSLTCQNEYCTHNSATIKSIVSELIWMLEGIPRNPMIMSQYIRDTTNSLKYQCPTVLRVPNIPTLPYSNTTGEFLIGFNHAAQSFRKIR